MKRATWTKAAALFVCVYGFMMFTGADGSICVPGEPDEPVCVTPVDCEGLPHIMCVGAWTCNAGDCDWQCGAPTPVPECETSDDCPAGEYCEGDCDGDAGNNCVPTCDPVVNNPCVTSGCSSEICAPEPMMSTCVYLDWYQCLGLSECGPYAEAWGCKWKNTPEFDECMAQYGM